MPFVPDKIQYNTPSFIPDEIQSPTARGFLEKVGEAFDRGQELTLSHIGISQALTDPSLDLEGAEIVASKLKRKEVLDPIESNFLSDLVYSGARVVGQMWETVKYGGPKAIVGGAVGAAVGLGAGAVLGGPTGEEPALGLAGAKLGAELAGGTSAALFSFHEGRGGMYLAMVEEGVDRELAKKIASIGAIPYAITEVAQVKTALPGIKEAMSKASGKTAKRIAATLAKRYGKKYVTEIGQELEQTIYEIASEDLAKELSGKKLPIGKEYFAEKSKRLYEVAKESAKGFALVSLPGAAIETAIITQNQVIANEIAQLESEPRFTSQQEQLMSMGEKAPVNVLIDDEGNIFSEEIEKEKIDTKTPITLEEKNFLVEHGATVKSILEATPEEVRKLIREIQEKEGPTEQRTKPDGTTGIFIRGTDKELHLSTELSEFADKVRKGQVIVSSDKISVSDMTTPEGKFFVGFRQAMATLKEQKKIRKKQLATKLKIGEEVAAEEKNNPNWYKTFFRQAMSGKFTELEIDPLKTFVPEEVRRQLLEQLRTTDNLKRVEAAKLSEAVDKLFFDGKLLRDHEIKWARKVWGDNLANLMEAAKESKGANWVDYFGIPRSTSSACDLSRTLRQNIVATMRHPILASKALVRDWNLFLKDEKTARLVEKDLLLKLGDYVKYIRWNDWGEGTTYKTGAEKFPSKVARLLPGIQRSERAFAMGGNGLRAELLLQAIENNPHMTEKQLKDIGHVINIVTGEGDIRFLKGIGPVINATLFAPRLLESRIRIITDLFNPRLSWAAWKMLAGHVALFIGVNTGILAAASMAGADVEWNPKSTDFGKIKIGKTRIDFWGGYLPLFRLAVQLYTGEIKTQTGREIPIEAKEAIINFLQAKLGPVPAFLLDMYNGETFYGDYCGTDADSLVKEFYNRLVPFFIQDIADALRYQGVGTGMAVAPLAFLGAGVNSYEMSKSAQIMQLKNTTAMRFMGMKWDELGSEVQDYIKLHQPEIELAERQEAFDRRNFKFLERIAKQKDQSQKRLYKMMPRDVQAEFDKLRMNLSGVSRTVDTDWFLNEKRYREYEQTTGRLYKTILTDIVRHPMWEKTPDEIKVLLLQDIMDDIKKKVRLDIIAKANIEDFEKVTRK